MVSDGGRVVDAVSRCSRAALRRLASRSVITSCEASRSLRSSKPISNRRYAGAIEVFHEREREHADLTSKVASELASKSQNFAKLEAAFEPGHQGDWTAHRLSDGRRQDPRGFAGQGIHDAAQRRGSPSRTRRCAAAKGGYPERDPEVAIAEDRSGDAARARNPAVGICVSTTPAGKWMRPRNVEPEHPGHQPDRGARP